MLLKTVMVVGDECGQFSGRSAEPRITALEHVANRPILHHVLDRLAEVSTDGVILVGDALALNQIEVSLRHYGHPLASVDYVVSRKPGHMGLVLAEVAPIVGGAACVLHPADGLLDSSTATFASLCAADDLDLVLVVPARPRHGSSEEWDTFDRARLAQDRVADAPEIAVLGPGMLLRAVSSGLLDRTSSSLSTLGQSLAAGGATVEVKQVHDWYRYSGGRRELLDLNRIILDRIAPDVPDALKRGNRIEGQVRIDPTASVRSSVIVGPSVIGPGAVISDSYIGPYTAIGSGVRIQGSEIERSIVSPGANVLHVGARIVSSLVGRDTRVVRDFTLPRALRLWVGDGDEIALC